MPYINGFLASPRASLIGIRTYRVPGTRVTLPVRSDIAPLLIGFAKEFHEKVEPLVVGWCWGYAYRAVRGGGSVSFHAAGLAIDLNAPRHPLGAHGTYSARQVAMINQLAKKYGLRAGINYRNRKDPMHFEVILGHGQALALVRRLQHQPPSKPNKPRPTPHGLAYPGKPVRMGWRNSAAVRAIQHKLGLNRDGDFGSKTKTAVMRWQHAHKLAADGVVGPRTWALMF